MNTAERVAELRADIEALARRELELRFERAEICAVAHSDGVSQSELARQLGVHSSTIWQWIGWAEIVDSARAELDDKFLCSCHAVSGLINGDYTADERLSILERALAFSLDGQPTETDVFEAVCRVPAFRRRYGSVPGLNRYRKRRHY